VRGLAAALRFLTVLPVPGKLGAEGRDLAAAPVWFPVVGVLIGAVSAGWAWLAYRLAPGPVAAVLVVGGLLAISKGLHLDGLADTADALLSSRTRERMLEIMKDSHVGVMGVGAVVLVLALKITALGALPPERAVLAAFLMPVAGRCAMLMLMGALPYARPEGGLGGFFGMGRRPLLAVWGVVALVGVGVIVGREAGLAAAGGTVLLAALLIWDLRRVLGGATGDTVGASCELAEVIPALVLAVAAMR
jgi:adenosylcobinamide-GDP ribazoletransferase